MASAIEFLLGNAAVAIALAMVAMIAALCRRPALAHVVWLLVLIKLLTPPIYRVHVKVPVARARPALVSIDESIDSTDIAVTAAPANAAPMPASALAPFAVPARRLEWLPILVLGAWGLGSAAILIRAIVQYRRFARTLHKAGACDEAIWAEVLRLAPRMGLKHSPEVRVMRGDASPMLYGVLRPVLVLPRSCANGLCAEKRAVILAHELAHLRRRDHWVRVVELLATAALWWHPLLWLARRGLRDAEEQCCDAWVIWLMPGSRKTYAEMLMDAVELFGNQGPCALPPAASGLGEFQYLKRRLIMIMSHNTQHRTSRLGKLILLAMLLALPLAPARAQESSSAKDEEIRQLRERVKELEAKVEQLMASTRPAQVIVAAGGGGGGAVRATQVTPPQRQALQTKARARARQDAKNYKPEQLAECEQLYQVANKNWRSPEAIVNLKQMVDKFPDVNRTGCAVLYLGQMSMGDTREEHLKQAVENHSDCFYLNGVQVGGFARYLLGHYYKETGQPEKAQQLFDEIITKYADAITHSGDSLVLILKAEENGAAK